MCGQLRQRKYLPGDIFFKSARKVYAVINGVEATNPAVFDLKKTSQKKV